RQALENVSTWVRAYYDTDDATTKAFLDEVDQLSQQNISMDLPETLQSQAMLEKLMQTRVRNLLAQPAAGTTEAKPAPAPAPQADTPAAAPQGE
ncbi:uroporphyrinogen-III C-methyltransferase, partial [Escherichia coli]